MADVAAPRKKVQKGEALWLMSFSDMSLVLLCFFVLMISVMKPNKEKFEHVKEGMVDKKDPTKKSLRELKEEVKKVIKDKKLDKAAQVSYDEKGFKVEFKDGLLFTSGSAKANKRMIKVTNEVLKAIASIDSKYSMNIEGHTDDTPLGKRNPIGTNWELSADRGFALLRMFQRLGVKESRMSVTAFAHTQPKVPIKKLRGKALKKARAANRRVVIRIE